MEAGITSRSKELGDNGFMVGPTSADPALQVRASRILIAQGVNVIGVVPNDATVLEPVLQKARDAGIKVITHESPTSRTRTGTSKWFQRKAMEKRTRSCLRRRWAAKESTSSMLAR